MDGHVLTELLNPDAVPPPAGSIPISTPGSVYQSSMASLSGSGGDIGDVSALSGVPGAPTYSDAEDAAIQQRLADLGYL